LEEISNIFVYCIQNPMPDDFETKMIRAEDI
jgi:hypothetical protein